MKNLKSKLLDEIKALRDFHNKESEMYKRTPGLWSTNMWLMEKGYAHAFEIIGKMVLTETLAVVQSDIASLQQFHEQEAKYLQTTSGNELWYIEMGYAHAYEMAKELLDNLCSKIESYTEFDLVV